MQRKRVIVRGVVQGVGFRWSTAREAARLGVTGWVANRPDGTVEAAVEGEPDAVSALLAYLRRGPLGARVTGIDVQEEGPLGETRFEIRR